jgi:hypothetical protein
MEDIPLGTIRWTGTELQIMFANTWNKIWPPDQETAPAIEFRKESYDISNVRLREKNDPVFTNALNIPPGGKEIIHIGFSLQGMQFKEERSSRTTGGTFGGLGGTKTETTEIRRDSVTVVARGNNNEIWKDTRTIRAVEGVHDGIVFETSLGSAIPVEQFDNLTFQFIATSQLETVVVTTQFGRLPTTDRSTNETRLKPHITVARIDVTYAVERQDA